MSEEAAFIEALTRDTLDDVTRAVYADWLEERGDPRAAFLRAEIALSQLPDGDPGWFELAAGVPRGEIDTEWAEAVGPRYDVWLLRYDMARKIMCIKVIREQTGIGLYEAKVMSESLPARVISSLPAGPTLRAAVDLVQAAACHSSVEVRRAGAPIPDLQPGWRSTIPSSLIPPGPHSLWLLGYPAAHKIRLIKAIRENLPIGLAEVKNLIESPLPLCLHATIGVLDAERLRDAYSPWATVEVRTT